MKGQWQEKGTEKDIITTQKGESIYLRHPKKEKRELDIHEYIIE
jgi:hypothetical protein